MTCGNVPRMTIPAPVPRHFARRAAWTATALVASALFLFPLVVMVLGSLRLPGLAPPSELELIPDPVTLEGWRRAFTLVPLARSMLNSLLVAAIYTPVAVVVASWAGFGIAQLRGRWRQLLVGLVLVLLMIPVTAMWIPRFAIFEAAGLVGSYVPLLAPALLGGSPFFVLLYAFAFRRIPGDVLDAARLEGAGPLHVWRRIAMPLVRSTTAAVAMLAFVQSWANFIDPLLYLDRESAYTAPLMLRFLETLGPTNWPVLLAGAAAVTAPVVLLFLVMQRFFLTEERGIGWIGR